MKIFSWSYSLLIVLLLTSCNQSQIYPTPSTDGAQDPGDGGVTEVTSDYLCGADWERTITLTCYDNPELRENSPFANGSGTASDPYGICTVEQLKELANARASDDLLDKHFVLLDNLKWPSDELFPMIGHIDETDGTIESFSGTFDGGGHTITGLRIGSRRANVNSVAKSNVGFVRRMTEEGVISNLHLHDLKVLVGENRTGGMVGHLEGRIENSSVMGSVLGDQNVGGLVGFIIARGDLSNPTAMIKDSFFVGSVHSTDGNVGGILGSVYSDNLAQEMIIVENNCVQGEINSTRSGHVGGLIGQIQQVEFQVSHNFSEANLYSGHQSKVGGLIGALRESAGGEESFITDNYVVGNVSGGNNETGGLIGSIESFIFRVEDNWFKGSLQGGQYAGGLIGQMNLFSMTWMFPARERELSIKNNHVVGEVRGKQYIGGLIGRVRVGNEDEDAGDFQFINLTIEGNSVRADVYSTYHRAGGLVGDFYYETRDNALPVLEETNSLLFSENSFMGDIWSPEQSIGGLVGYLRVYLPSNDPDSKFEQVQLIDNFSYLTNIHGGYRVGSFIGDSIGNYVFEKNLSFVENLNCASQCGLAIGQIDEENGNVLISTQAPNNYYFLDIKTEAEDIVGVNDDGGDDGLFESLSLAEFQTLSLEDLFDTSFEKWSRTEGLFEGIPHPESAAFQLPEFYR